MKEPHAHDPDARGADARPPRRPVHDTLSRRSFLKGAGGVAAAGGLADAALAQEDEEAAGVPTLTGTVEVRLDVNGAERAVAVEPRTTLLSALRDRMGLTGSKLVCDTGSCGACTVLIDGRPAYACIQLAVQCEGRAVTTVEGLGSPDAMSDVQDAFCEKDGLMCGFCTPGFVVATHAALDRRPDATLEEIQHELSGNLCRCGTYPFVFEAALEAQRRRRSGGEEEDR